MSEANYTRVWRGLPWVMAVAFLVRVAMALAGRSIHFPDEVFQYLEQAHRLVFGNGLVPWEFRFGTRSWLLPLFIGGPLSIAQWLGLDRPVFYIPMVKIVLCAISTTVVPMAYAAGRRLVSEDAGKLAAVLAAGWYELIYFSYRPLPDVLSAYLVLGALVLALGARPRGAAFWFGLTVAGAVVLRTQLVPVAGVLFVVALRRWSFREWRTVFATGLVVIVLAGGLDRLTWGSWFASSINNYVFNVVYGVSAMFGVNSPVWYPVHLAITSFGTLVMAFLLSLRWWRRLWAPCSLVLILVLSHSVIAHKEYRFIFAAIPMLLVLAAAVTVLATERLNTAAALRRRYVVLGLFGLVSVAGLFNRLPSEDRVYRPTPLFAADPSLDAYVYLSGVPSLTALFVADEQWWYSGGYYHLHRDVPLYFVSDLDAMMREGGAGPEIYASHVLHRGDGVPTPGFREVARFGPVSVLENVTGVALRPLEAGSRQMSEDKVDHDYQPNVRPFLTPPR